MTPGRWLLQPGPGTASGPPSVPMSSMLPFSQMNVRQLPLRRKEDASKRVRHSIVGETHHLPGIIHDRFQD